jgi:predicted amidophosphoribosyltransferase
MVVTSQRREAYHGHLFQLGHPLIHSRSRLGERNEDDPISRKQQLQGAFRVRDRSLIGKAILLFDDIYRSGETLREATRVLYDAGQVKAVYVLVITKTRRRR